MTPGEKFSELLAENSEIKRAADANAILLGKVLRQNRDYKAKIGSLKGRVKVLEQRSRKLLQRSKIHVAKNKSLQRQNDENEIRFERARRGVREVIEEVKRYLLNKKVTLAITIANGTGAIPSRHISPRKRQRKLNRKVRQLEQLRSLLEKD